MTALLYSVDKFSHPSSVTEPATNTDMLCIDGPDAVDFAHGQLASDVRSLASGQWQWSAWLDARGRVRSFGQLARQNDNRLCFFLRGGNAESTAQELTRYLFRSRLTITVTRAMQLSSGESLGDGVFRQQDDGFRLGHGESSTRYEREPPCSTSPNQSDHVLADIVRGFPWLPDGLPAQLPPALGLYRLGAVRIDKGCYPGQEIVSRLHHLGGAKQHLHHLRLKTADIPDRITATDGAGGWVLLRSGTDVLAVLDDRSASAAESFAIVRSFPA